MAVPKRRMSRSRTRHRRSRWQADRPQLVEVRVNGEIHRVPRRLVAAVKRGHLKHES